jgi:hypothetical protein
MNVALLLQESKATVRNKWTSAIYLFFGAVHMMLIEPVLVVWDVLKMTLAISS